MTKIHSSSDSLKRKLKNLWKEIQRTNDFSLLSSFFEKYNIWYDYPSNGDSWWRFDEPRNRRHRRLFTHSQSMLNILLELPNKEFRLFKSWITKIGKKAKYQNSYIRLSELLSCFGIVWSTYNFSSGDKKYRQLAKQEWKTAVENGSPFLRHDPRYIIFYKKIEGKVKIEVDHFICYDKIERKLRNVDYGLDHPWFPKSVESPNMKKFGGMELPINAKVTVQPYKENANEI